jgi:hypothetical protein
VVDPGDNAAMSEVTNVLLAFSILEDADARIAEVNAWLDEVEQLPLGSVWDSDSAVGGGKRMDAPLYAGAFNYFDLPGFLAFLRTVAWSQPSDVQVIVRAHDEDRWRAIDA